MRQDFQRLRRIVAATVEAMGYELVGVEFHPRPGNALLRVYIDG
ncbi:MAG: ribosome maturation factor, partial [Candidatus Competibacteraceae bacterium]|nr:ribosome maturation factor [Candidatus Competibacteraceae bacterium]